MCDESCLYDEPRKLTPAEMKHKLAMAEVGHRNGIVFAKTISVIVAMFIMMLLVLAKLSLSS